MDFFEYLHLLLAVVLVFKTIVRADNNDHGDQQKQPKLDELASMEGHMKPLGSVGPYFQLFIIEGFPSSPRKFFNKYVIPSTPVVMKNAAKVSPAFTKWTDSYFISHPESDRMEIYAEGRKKEIRTEPGSTMTFKQFVELYNTTDMYMVHGLPKHLRSDVIIPPPLQCDPVVENLYEIVTWFSSGGTKSLLHIDEVDNLNCLYRGNKTLVFVNPHDHKNLWKNLIDRLDGGYSSMDVDAVDYTKFPDLAKVRYSKVDMQAGDCLFIPYGWYHQVNSFGSNLAVNLWWKHRPQQFFDLTEEVCGVFTGRNTIANISYPDMDEAEYDKYLSAPGDDEPSGDEYSKYSKPNIQPEGQGLTDTVYRAVIRFKKLVKINGLKYYLQKKFIQDQIWDDRCQEILINFFGLLDQNNDTALTRIDAKLFHEKDDETLSQLQEKGSYLEMELRVAKDSIVAEKNEKLVQKLLDRGELDKEQIATIFGNKLVMPAPSQHEKDEL
ncbi:uncharacterized protein LOC120337776 [Styela clava]